MPNHYLDALLMQGVITDPSELQEMNGRGRPSNALLDRMSMAGIPNSGLHLTAFNPPVNPQHGPRGNGGGMFSFPEFLSGNDFEGGGLAASPQRLGTSPGAVSGEVSRVKAWRRWADQYNHGRLPMDKINDPGAWPPGREDPRVTWPTLNLGQGNAGGSRTRTSGTGTRSSWLPEQDPVQPVIPTRRPSLFDEFSFGQEAWPQRLGTSPEDVGREVERVRAWRAWADKYNDGKLPMDKINDPSAWPDPGTSPNGEEFREPKDDELSHLSAGITSLGALDSASIYERAFQGKLTPQDADFLDERVEDLLASLKTLKIGVDEGTVSPEQYKVALEELEEARDFRDRVTNINQAFQRDALDQTRFEAQFTSTEEATAIGQTLTTWLGPEFGDLSSLFNGIPSDQRDEVLTAVFNAVQARWNGLEQRRQFDLTFNQERQLIEQERQAAARFASALAPLLVDLGYPEDQIAALEGASIDQLLTLFALMGQEKQRRQRQPFRAPSVLRAPLQQQVG